MRTKHCAGSGFKFQFSNLACFQNWKTGRVRPKAECGAGDIWPVLGTSLSLFAV